MSKHPPVHPLAQAVTPAGVCRKLLRFQVMRAAAAAANARGADAESATALRADCLGELFIDRTAGVPQWLLACQDASDVARQLGLESPWRLADSCTDAGDGDEAVPLLLDAAHVQREIMREAAGGAATATAWPGAFPWIDAADRRALDKVWAAEAAAWPELRALVPLELYHAHAEMTEEDATQSIARYDPLTQAAIWRLLTATTHQPPSPTAGIARHAALLLAQAGWAVDAVAQGPWTALATSYQLSVAAALDASDDEARLEAM